MEFKKTCMEQKLEIFMVRYCHWTVAFENYVTTQIFHKDLNCKQGWYLLKWQKCDFLIIITITCHWTQSLSGNVISCMRTFWLPVLRVLIIWLLSKVANLQRTFLKIIHTDIFLSWKEKLEASQIILAKFYIHSFASNLVHCLASHKAMFSYIMKSEMFMQSVIWCSQYILQ